MMVRLLLLELMTRNSRSCSAGTGAGGCSSSSEGLMHHEDKDKDLARVVVQQMMVEEEEVEEVGAKRGFLIISQTDKEGRTQTGLCAAVLLDDYKCGKIKRHEELDASVALMLDPDMDPLLLAHRDDYGDVSSLLTSIIEKSQGHVCEHVDGSYILWSVTAEADVRAIEEAFEGVESLYIADGHHRAALLATREEERFLVSFLFPHSSLKESKSALTIEAILDTADQGTLLPPKATFFESKPPRHLVKRVWV